MGRRTILWLSVASRATLLDQVLQAGKVFLQFVARAVGSDIDFVEAHSGTDGRVSSMRPSNGNDGQPEDRRAGRR